MMTAFDPTLPRLCDLGDGMREAIAVGTLGGQSLEVRAVVPTDTARRLRLAVHQSERTLSMSLVDGDTVVATTATCT